MGKIYLVFEIIGLYIKLCAKYHFFRKKYVYIYSYSTQMFDNHKKREKNENNIWHSIA